MLNNPYFEFIVGRAKRKINEEGKSVYELSSYPESLGECDRDMYLSMMAPGYRNEVGDKDPWSYYGFSHPFCFKNRDEIIVHSNNMLS